MRELESATPIWEIEALELAKYLLFSLKFG